MKTKALMHRHGGRITQITGIAHEAHADTKDTRPASYYFLADVEWFDGTRSNELKVPPFAIVLDEENMAQAEREYTLVSDNLADYLRVKGEWCDDGKHRHWMPFYSKGRVDFDGPRWVKVPTRFLADYISRGLDAPSTRAYCSLKSHNYIDANDEAIERLIIEARYTATQRHRGMAQSAKALLRALRDANVTTYTFTPGD